MFLDGFFNLFKKAQKGKADAKPKHVEVSLDDIEGLDIEDLLGSPLSDEDDDIDINIDKIDETAEGAEAESEEEDKEEALETIKAPSAEKVNYSDIDQEIEALLAQDIPLERNDVEFSHLQNVEVHENREDFSGYASPSKPENEKLKKLSSLFDGLSMKTMYIIAGAMLVLIILLAAVLFLLFTYSNNARERELQSKNIYLSQPAYVSNNANFIYLNRMSSFYEEDIVLVKMLIDSTATLFYFQQNLDVSNLDFTLEDEDGKLYSMDLTYAEYGQDIQEGGSVLHFEPLDLSVLNYKLTISDGKQSCAFPFKLDNGTTMPPAKYLTVPQDPLVNVPGLSLTVSGGTLSSSGSVIHFKLQWEDPSMKIQMGTQDSSDVLGMTESGRVVVPDKSRPLLYDFVDDNSILGRMDFQAVKSLSGKLRITFKNLYKKIQVNAELPTQGLFTNTVEGQQVYVAGNYDVVLERMGWQKDNIILVFHTENRDVFAKSGENVESRYSGRVEATLDAQLIVKTASGMEIALDGRSTSGQKGTDMIFSAGMAKGFMENGQPEDIVLKIKSILIKMDPVSVEYDLDKVRSHQDANTDRTLDLMLDSFKKRLAHKSGEISAADISGFSDEVLRDNRLMSNYEPVPGAHSPSYAARFVTYSINGNEMQGVVQELWKADIDGKETRFYRTHRIWAEIGESGWHIVRDEIIM